MMRTQILAITALLLTSIFSYAGGPAFVAGSGYNPGIQGQPLIWANGSVQYFTDQGILSPILNGPQADAFVATAFATWTTTPGVALTATQAGHLAEDVNGNNIQANEGVVTAPRTSPLQPPPLRLESSTTATEPSPMPCSGTVQATRQIASPTPSMADLTTSPPLEISCTRCW